MGNQSEHDDPAGDAADAEYDLLAMGELLVDLISTEPTDTLASARSFERHQGGSPANIAVNVARLGGRAALLANVGDDAFGAFLTGALEDAGVSTSYVSRDAGAHTSLVVVARTTATPDFLPLRDADYRLTCGDDDPHACDRVARAVVHARAVHVSTWPLSREPARSCVRWMLRFAHAQEKLTSLDPNYSPRIWPDRREALAVLRDVLPYVTVVKPSQDDARRLFDEALPPETAIERFHALGPRIVLYTMGQQGMLLSKEGQITHIPAREIEVADATGAGDAFWSGFLLAMIDGLDLRHCAYVAREIAEQKLRTVGPLPETQDRQRIYEKAAQARTDDEARDL
jgi:fructokinase